MAFTCEIRFTEEHLGGPVVGPAHLVEYRVRRGDMVATGGTLAIVRTPAGLHAVRTRFPRWVDATPARPGPIEPGQRIVVAAAEGDQIPPGFRYCVLDPMPEDA